MTFSRHNGSSGLRRQFSVAAVVAGLAVSSTAWAQQPSKEDVAKADALFREAQVHVQKSQYSEACAKFAESQTLDPANGTALNLALCHEKEGKTATAYRELQELISILSGSKTANDKERLKLANERIKQLEPKLTKVTFDVSELPNDASLALDTDRVITDPASPIAIDPGTHTVSATAAQKKPGKKVFDSTSPGTTTIKLDPLDDLNPPPPPPSEPKPTETQEAPPPSPTFWTGERVLGVAFAGVGLGGIAVGTIFGLDTFTKRDARDFYCNGTVCDAEGIRLHELAGRSATISSIGFGAGAALFVLGTVLFITGSPKARPPAASTAMQNGPTRFSVGPSGISGVF